VQKAAQEGYALDAGELSEDIRCMAAATMDREGRVVAAISISAPAARLSLKMMTELRPPLVDAALGISRTMGYQGPDIG
jgi:DNA-binding IclR family transcriptional regulator